MAGAVEWQLPTSYVVKQDIKGVSQDVRRLTTYEPSPKAARVSSERQQVTPIVSDAFQT